MNENTIIADLERRLATAGEALHEKAQIEAALRQSEELRRIAIARLRESEAGNRLLIERGAQAVWEADANGVVVADSPSWRAYTGQTIEEWLGYGWLDAIHPDDRTYAKRQWQAAIAVQGFVDAEFRLRAPNGGWRWTNVRATPVLKGEGQVEKWVGLNFDIEARKRAEVVLRENEERQAFLLKLSDTLRPLGSAAQARTEACRLLGEQLSSSRAYYVEYEPTLGYGIVADDYLVPGLSSLAGRYPFDMFRSTYERISDGRTWVIRDIAADRELPEQERAFYAAQGVLAWIDVPLAKDGVLEAALCVVQTEPRDWTALDIVLVEETAERMWTAIQRARAETILQESEKRFAQFAASSSDGLWIREAATLAMEYVNPAIEAIYGVSTDAIVGDVQRWAGLIVPEDRPGALACLERARQGEAVVHEFRIQRPSDGTFRWIRSTDFPLHDAQGRIQRIGGIAHDQTEAKLATEHTAVLLAELQHRVRNIMAQISAITAHTGEQAKSVSDYASLMAGRLLALARVQALLTRAANAGASITSIVQDELSAQARHRGQYVLDGPDVILPPKAAEVLTLAVHELTTNALKYGALSASSGRVTVRWTTFERRGSSWLSLDWTEEGAPERVPPGPSAPRRSGFGTELIEGRIPYELKGRGELTIKPGGAHCHLEFPLLNKNSILETGAPQRATVFGGSLDMTGEADLSGLRVLVIEDDYYLATDAARGLRGAGAEVLGPSSTGEDVRAELTQQRPDAAVIDINLGDGPSFALAETLKDQGIPFVFITGYNQEIIPAKFNDIERLEKPVQLRQIVDAVAKLVDRTG
ncbi:PAS domain-containing protein [Methylobacterium sp. 17Sr1-1]|uniref:PAS domain-containing protein n=1 Tax=Methylobacterium sp. 17Sr1-1 TaxID=2202826 RepID=UPI000D6ED3E9|nr:PAS domain-containing protein [Methylobacterium sp. 17Sr1-1]AWN51069.1 histidine kinase [Methylobacterium sp. 17Sr1-1]